MRITESKLRSIIRSVIRESEEDIYRRFPSEHAGAGFEEENIVDYTDEENFPGVDEYDFDDEYVDYGEVRAGPFGLTPEEREELYRSRVSAEFPEDFQPEQDMESVRIPRLSAAQHRESQRQLRAAQAKPRPIGPELPKGPISHRQKEMIKNRRR